MPIIPVCPRGSGCISRHGEEVEEEEDDDDDDDDEDDEASISVAGKISTWICDGGNPALVPEQSSSTSAPASLLPLVLSLSSTPPSGNSSKVMEEPASVQAYV